MKQKRHTTEEIIRILRESTGTIPTRAQSVNHVWSWDFISDRTDNGGKLRILSVTTHPSPRRC